MASVLLPVEHPTYARHLSIGGLYQRLAYDAGAHPEDTLQLQGAGLTLVLVVLGALREFVGSGTLLSGIEMIIPGASPIVLFGDDYDGGHKAWVRWPDGRDDIVPGSQVQRQG